eukprot:1141380-Pelagomonas_calceolata.AAC.8
MSNLIGGLGLGAVTPSDTQDLLGSNCVLSIVTEGGSGWRGLRRKASLCCMLAMSLLVACVKRGSVRAAKIAAVDTKCSLRAKSSWLPDMPPYAFHLPAPFFDTCHRHPSVL